MGNDMRKICMKPFTNIRIDGEDGELELCSWIKYPIGKLSRDGMQGAWNNDMARKIRSSILDGSYRYCDKEDCVYLCNDTLPEISEEEYNTIREEVKNLPTHYWLAYDKVCNHVCPSCRKKIYIPTEEYKRKMKEMEQYLLPLLKNAEFVSVTGVGDPFASKYTMDLLSKLKLKDENSTILFETNGACFDEVRWDKLKNLHQYKIQIIITPNSFVEDTYRYLNGDINDYSKLQHSLTLMSKLRCEGAIERVTVTMVVQDTNYREVPEFVKKCLQEYNADEVCLRYIHYWNEMSREECWHKDVANPLHPYFEDYKRVMESPVLRDKRVVHWNGSYAHEPIEHPSVIYRYNYEMLYWATNIENSERKVGELLKSKGVEQIVIYGATKMVTTAIRSCEAVGIKILYILDKYNWNKNQDASGYVIKDFTGLTGEEKDILILPEYYRADIEKDINTAGFSGNIHSYYELLKELAIEMG